MMEGGVWILFSSCTYRQAQAVMDGKVPHLKQLGI
jgi:hypothetical protein